MEWGKALWASYNSQLHLPEGSCQTSRLAQSGHEPVVPFPAVELRKPDSVFYILRTRQSTHMELPLHCHEVTMSSTCTPTKDNHYQNHNIIKNHHSQTHYQNHNTSYIPRYRHSHLILCSIPCHRNQRKNLHYIEEIPVLNHHTNILGFRVSTLSSISKVLTCTPTRITIIKIITLILI